MGYRAMTTAFLRAADAVARPIDRAGVAVCRTTRPNPRAPFSRLETVTHHIVARVVVVVVAHVAAGRRERAVEMDDERDHGGGARVRGARDDGGGAGGVRETGAGRRRERRPRGRARRTRERVGDDEGTRGRRTRRGVRSVGGDSAEVLREVGGAASRGMSSSSREDNSGATRIEAIRVLWRERER